MLTCLVPVLLTFYIQAVLKLKKNNSGAKGLKVQPVPRKQIRRCKDGSVDVVWENTVILVQNV